MALAIDTIVRLFNERGSGRYGDECVSQLEHAIQCACLAQEAGASGTQVIAALLHDLGHIIDGSDMPHHNDQNLDDLHEEKAYQWLLSNFGPAVAEPVRLHVLAKRYLCTVDPEYQSHLSPTSLKSFFDQGGFMSEAELAEFKNEKFYSEALELRRRDDLAKDENKVIPSIESFIPLMTECLVTAS